MKKLVLKGPAHLEVVDEAETPPGTGEVALKVYECGICGSDIHAYLGKHPFVRYPVTPGHEFAGEVVALGYGVDPSLLGRRACVEPSLACGKCPQCASGRYNICSRLRVMGFQAPGAMREIVCVPAVRLHMLPDGVSTAGGALAEPAAVAAHAFARSGARRGDAVLVFGAGVIGLLLTKIAAAKGCQAVVVEKEPARAERAVKFGAEDAVVFGGGAALPEQLTRLSAGGRLRAVFECAGSAEAIDAAVRLAPRGSTVVVAGVFPGPTPVPLELIQDGELDVRGTLMYTGADFEEALWLIGEGLSGGFLFFPFFPHRGGADSPGRFHHPRLSVGRSPRCLPYACFRRGFRLEGDA